MFSDYLAMVINIPFSFCKVQNDLCLLQMLKLMTLITVDEIPTCFTN